MLRGRRERGSSASASSSSGGGPGGSSLLIPPNPAVADPGSSPTSRGGILLNPLSKDGSPTTALPPSHRSSSLASNTSRNRGTPPSRRSASLSSNASHRSYASTSSIASNSTRSEDADSNTGSDGSSSTNPTSVTSPRLKFAPLPESGRIKRSNSITLGVAARAQLLQGNGMGGGGGGGDRPGVQRPHWQQQVYNPNAQPMWYNGGPMPDNVKTLKDLKPGIKKAWGALRRRRSSSNASSQSTSSTASTSTTGAGVEGGGGGTSSEGDISSINEEDEESETPPPVGTPALTGQGTGPSAATGQGPESVTVTKEGVLVDQPPGLELNKATSSQQQSEGLEGGQPLSRKDSDAYSDISSSALSEAETDMDTREAYITSQGRSESPQYTPGAGPSGHYYLHHSHHHPNNYPGYLHEENNEGVRSGEVTPRRGHSPPSSPGGGVNEKAYNGKHHQHHWTPQVADLHAAGSGSTPGSGANTPRRRMSLGDMSSFSNANHQQGYPHHHSQKGTSVFGFDEAQLKNRLGQMDLNSRRRKPTTHEQDENEDENENQEDDEDEVPMPVDSKQVRGAGLELAV